MARHPIWDLFSTLFLCVQCEWVARHTVWITIDYQIFWTGGKQQQQQQLWQWRKQPPLLWVECFHPSPWEPEMHSYPQHEQSNGTKWRRTEREREKERSCSISCFQFILVLSLSLSSHILPFCTFCMPKALNTILNALSLSHRDNFQLNLAVWSTPTLNSSNWIGPTK